MTPRVSALIVAVGLTVAGVARADDEPVNVLAQPRLPSPMILPEITHPRTDVGISWTVGAGSTDRENRPTVGVAIMRLQFEDSFIWRRRLYAGVTWDFASALPPDRGPEVDSDLSTARTTGMIGRVGNVEPHVRVAFPLTEGLTIGTGMGLVVPTSNIERTGPVYSAMLAAASLEPTDYVHFLTGRLAFRPFGDLRIVRGAFVFQARQGFDIVIDDAGVESARTAGRILLHAGVTLTRAIELSVEATEVYFLFIESPFEVDPNLPAEERAAEAKRLAARERYRVSDDRRAKFNIGPSLRLSFPNVDLGIGLVSNLFEPLSPALDSVIAARVSLMAHFR